jgi:uncharacterized protein YhdP
VARAWQIGIRVAGGALAVSALGAGALAWRLARGPIGLDFLTPRIEAALAPPDGSLRVAVRSTQLEWVRESHDVDLRVHGVRVSAATGAEVGTVPVMALRLSLWGLLRGRVVPRQIEAVGTRVHLVRSPDGRITLGEGAEAATGTLGGDLLALGLVEIRDAAVTLTDLGSGTAWQVGDVDLTLAQRDGAVTAGLRGTLAAGALRIPLRVEGLHRPEATETDLTFTVEPLEPATLATVFPELAPLLSVARLPVGGTVEVVIDGTLRPVRARVDLAGGPGTLAPGAPWKPMDVATLGVAAAVDLASGAIDVERLSLGLPPATAAVEGRLGGLGSGSALDLEATVTGLPTGVLARYWPSDVVPAARRWVATCLDGGQVRRAKARLRGALGGAPPGGVAIEAIDATLAFDGLAVRYLETMPPARGVAGEGSCSPKTCRLRVARGTLDALEIVRADVAVTGLDRAAPTVTVDGAVRGPLARGLAVLANDPRLDPLAGLGLQPRDVSGRMTAQVRLDFPLADAPDLGQIEPRVSAELRGVTFPVLPGGWALSAGDLDLELAGSTLELTGRAHLTHALVPGSTTPWLDGPVGARVRLVEARGGTERLDLHLDLRDTVLDVPALDLAKRAGAPGAADTSLTIAGGAVTAIDRFALESGGSRIEGRATLTRDGAWQTVDAEAVIAPPRPGEQAGHFTLGVRPDGGSSRLTLGSDDAGVLFRALETYADAEGGRLTFDGEARLDAPGLPFAGRVDVRGFTLTRSPVLARVVQMSSLPGIADTLRNRGLQFSQLTASIAHRDGILTLTDGLAAGPSLGIQWSATVDRVRGTVTGHGTLAPSYYGLNRSAARVPLVGQVLTGVNREGFQAVEFDVRGPLGDPRVSVQPLSVLAPGILRDLMHRVTPR